MFGIPMTLEQIRDRADELVSEVEVGLTPNETEQLRFIICCDLLAEQCQQHREKIKLEK